MGLKLYWCGRIIFLLLPFYLIATYSTECAIKGKLHKPYDKEKYIRKLAQSPRGSLVVKTVTYIVYDKCHHLKGSLIAFGVIYVPFYVVDLLYGYYVLESITNKANLHLPFSIDGLVFLTSVVLTCIELATYYIFLGLMFGISKYMDEESDRKRVATEMFIAASVIFSIKTILFIFINFALVKCKRKSKPSPGVALATVQQNLAYESFDIDSLGQEIENSSYLIEYPRHNETWLFIEKLMNGTWKYPDQRGRDAVNLSHSAVKLKKIYRVKNEILLGIFSERNDIGMSTSADHVTPKILTLDVLRLPTDIKHYRQSIKAVRPDQVARSCSQPPHLDSLGKNEVYLFHGTPAKNVISIIENGLDVGRSGNGLYGKGIYLAESSQKADQYTDAKYNRRKTDLTMFVVRTRLGKVGTDCIVAGLQNRFREFVVKDSANLYPEFLVLYDRI